MLLCWYQPRYRFQFLFCGALDGWPRAPNDQSSLISEVDQLAVQIFVRPKTQKSPGSFRLVCQYSWQPWIGFDRLTTTTIVWPREMQAKAAHQYHLVYRSPPRLPSEPTEKDGCHLDLPARPLSARPLSRIRKLSNRSAALSAPSPRDRVGNTSVLSVRSRALALVVALSVGHHLQTWFARMQVSNSIFN